MPVSRKYSSHWNVYTSSSNRENIRTINEAATGKRFQINTVSSLQNRSYFLRFAGEREGENKARGERGAQVTRDRIRTRLASKGKGE